MKKTTTPAVATPDLSHAPGTGTHEYRDDPRNRDVLIYVNGAFTPREQAVVSVFDSGFASTRAPWRLTSTSGWIAGP